MINLLPEKEKKQLKQEYIFRLLIVSFSLVSILALVASLFLAPSYKYSVLKESITQNNLETFNAQNPQIDIENLNNEIAITNKKLSFIISKKSNISVSEDVIEKILALRTAGISFNHLSYNFIDEKNISINIIGVATNRTSLRSLKDALTADPLFASVDLPISNFIKPTDIDFNISLVLK